MRHSEQVRIIKQLCAHLDAGTSVDAGGLRVMPTSSYVDRDLAQREWQEFFLAGPQVMGLSQDLPEPGAFLTNNDLGVPILATRDSDGSFKAFVNACRHRGALVETQERGTARRFTCPFHAWSYDTGGALAGLPKSDHFGDLDHSCLGLRPLPAEERHGLLFVHPDPDGVLDLDALLGEWFNDEFSTWGFETVQPLTRDAYDTDCNWKLAMDTFGETYHFSVLHRNTLFNGFHGNVQLHDEEGHLHRMILCRRNIDTMRLLPEEEWRITGAALPVYWLFPNAILMPFDAGVFLVRAYPDRDNPGRHLSRIDFYIRPDIEGAVGRNPEMDAFLSDIAHNFAEIIRDEDYVMGASQQAAANSGALRNVVFGRNEPTLHHYHNTYRRVLCQPLLPLLDEQEVPAALG
ncbi:MAG: aromatic ring-hydroxylating dioxygenase subunit alpha [Ilumatobacteraceae bacterium]